MPVRAAFFLVVAVLLSGCSSLTTAVSVRSAQVRLEQAREAGAEEVAPFEYYYAREHWLQAQREAANSSHSDAATYASTAETWARKALDIANAAKKEATP